MHNSLNVLRRTPSEYSETYIIKASNATTRRNVEQERLSKSGADGRQTSLKFGNFLGTKITAVKTDLAKCTLLDQFLLQ